MHEECFLNQTLSKNNDNAFMGRTHAISAVALFLTILAFWSDILLKVLKTDNLWVIVLSLCVVSGAALIPDLDNTKSTSKSSLGLLGNILSILFRGSSAVIQTTIRTKYDDSTPNPHRGFWHTIVACILLGGLTFLGTQINSGSIDVPKIGTLTTGGVIALVITWLNVHLCLAGLVSGTIKKFKRKVAKDSIVMGDVIGEIASFVLSLIITVAIFIQIPDNINFWWLGLSVFLGCFFHLLGDAFTTMGVPLFFPIPIKGKLWYNLRILPIHAGGVVENFIFMPFFILLGIFSAAKIFHLF